MKNLWRIVLLLLVLAPVASIGFLGCGGSEPQPQQGDIDTAAIDAEAEAEQVPADAGEAGPPAAPEGEETLPEGGP